MNPRVRAILDQHDVYSTEFMGWRGIENGELLAIAQDQFDVFITLDRNLEYQHDVMRFAIGVVVVRVPANAPAVYLEIAAELHNALEGVGPGQVIRVTHPDLEPES